MWTLLHTHPFLDDVTPFSPNRRACSTARDFCYIIRERDTAAWLEWQRIAASGPLAGFTKHLCCDEATFPAAIQQPWSNEPVKGHVYHLKSIKRSIYGRASFDLLRLRVLHAA